MFDAAVTCRTCLENSTDLIQLNTRIDIEKGCQMEYFDLLSILINFKVRYDL